MQKSYSNKKIKELLTKLTISNKTEMSKLCKIVEIDEDELTCVCKPLDETPSFFGVRFAVDKSATMILYPKVDDIVIINYLDKRNAYISKINSADKITISNKEASLKDILKKYIDDLHSALDSATWSTAQGPTVSPAINKTQFDQAKDNAKDSIDKLFKN